MTSLVTMPFTIGVELLKFNLVYDIVCKIFHFLTASTVPFSAFIMVAIAVDRYICIVHPFKHRTSMTARRVKVIVALLFLLAIPFEPPHEKTNNLHMRKQGRRTASQ